jgi:hypothetical protein
MPIAKLPHSRPVRAALRLQSLPHRNGVQGRQSMCQIHREPKLSELLSDPILHLLLERDGVSLEELQALIEKTRRRHPAKGPRLQ